MTSVWHPETRSFVDEAVRCHHAGAQRASVVSTWTAVCVDLLAKLEYLSEDGVGLATTVITPVAQARSLPGEQGVNAVRELEGALVEHALGLDLIDPAGAIALRRLHEDRHRCAHPSLTAAGVFQPSAEQVRAHIVAAIDLLLAHPPVQGRLAIERFKGFLADEGPVTDKYVLSSYWRVATDSLRRQLVDLAAKVALGVVQPTAPENAPARAARSLRVFATRDHLLVVDRFRSACERLPGLTRASQWSAVARVGSLPEFWEALPEPIRSHLDATLADGDDQELLDSGILGLAGVPLAAQTLSNLSARFEALDASAKATMIGSNPAQGFLALAPNLLRDARSFRSAESLFLSGVLPLAGLMNVEDLARVLAEWAGNDQCSRAAGMVHHAVQLFDNTRHLLPHSLPSWQEFIAQAAESEPGGWYHYEELRQRLRAATHRDR